MIASGRLLYYLILVFIAIRSMIILRLPYIDICDVAINGLKDETHKICNVNFITLSSQIMTMSHNILELLQII